MVDNKVKHHKKDYIITIGTNKYSFNRVVIRSKFAPIVKLDLNKLKVFKPTGFKVVDDSEIRVCRINKTYKLITGYNQIQTAISNVKEGEDCIADCKMMSESYLESSKADIQVTEKKEEVIIATASIEMPITEKLEKLASVGFRIKPSRKT